MIYKVLRLKVATKPDRGLEVTDSLFEHIDFLF